MSKARRHAIFHAGSEALAQYFPTTAPVYYCPICGECFVAADLGSRLTLEDVPPKSIGGKPLVLTCADCNHSSGHTVDAAVGDRARTIEYLTALAGKGSFRGRAHVKIDGEAMNAEINIPVDGPVEILGTGNSPAKVERVTSVLDDHIANDTWEGKEITVSLPAFNNRLSQVSDLKSAFLIAFALFGYRYAFDFRLKPVRDQLLNPHEKLISGFCVALPGEFGWKAALVRQPIPMVFIMIDRFGIALPWLFGPNDLYAELQQRYPGGANLKLFGKEMPWPTRSSFMLDHTPGPFSLFTRDAS